MWQNYEKHMNSTSEVVVSFWWLCKKRQVFHQSEKWKQSKTMNTCIIWAAMAPVFWPPHGLRGWAQAGPSPWLAVHHDWHTRALLLFRCPSSLSGKEPSWRDPTLNCSECNPALKWTLFFMLFMPLSTICGAEYFHFKMRTLLQKQLSYWVQVSYYFMFEWKYRCQNFWRGGLRKAKLMVIG